MKKHVAVCAFPWTSHPTALLHLIRPIAVAAPETHFSFFNTQESNLKLFQSPAASELPTNICPYNVDNGVPEGYVFSSPNKLLENIGLFMEAGFENVRKSLTKVEEETKMKIECVISDVFMWFCGKIAEEKKVDWIAVWNGSPHSLCAHLHTDVIRSKFGVNGTQGACEDETLDFIPGFSTVRVSDVQREILCSEFETPVGQILYKGTSNLPKATAVIMPCFEELEPIIVQSLKSKLPNLLCTGLPLLSMHHGGHHMTPNKPPPEDPYGCLRWLDNHNSASVVYISFGSLGIVPIQDLVALAQALIDHQDIPFLWVLSDDAKSKLPQEFVEESTKSGRGKFVTWSPQTAVLAHHSIGVTITHCGWNSFLESLVSSVPSICKPSFADQMLNTRFVVSEFRVGIEVDGGNKLTKSGVEAALVEVLMGHQGCVMREKLDKLKQLAQESSKPGGSSSINFTTLVNMVA